MKCLLILCIFNTVTDVAKVLLIFSVYEMVSLSQNLFKGYRLRERQSNLSELWKMDMRRQETGGWCLHDRCILELIHILIGHWYILSGVQAPYDKGENFRKEYYTL